MPTLPKELNYTSKLQALPPLCRTISCVVSPINGTTFSSGGDLIQFDMGSRGYLVPQSLYIRYRNSILKPTEVGYMLGTPVYTPFSRLEVIIGNNVVETIQDYNQVCNMVTQCKLNSSQVSGVASAFGFIDHTSTPVADTLNGNKINFGASAVGYDFAGPLNCILSNCENLFPLQFAPAVRIQLTTESLVQMFQASTSGVTSSTLSRLELCYDIVEFGPEVDAVVKSMADANGELIVKSQSYSSSTLNMPSGSSGTLEYSFNQRISSIKSIFAHLSPTITTGTGARKFSSKDVTKSLGSYQYFIGSEAYPPRPLDATCKPGMFMELLQAWGNNSSVESYNKSITPAEYARVDGTVDTVGTPGKFYVGCNTERLCGSALLTGVSSQLSPIALRINIPSATTDAHNVTLITLYDALISLNVVTRQASVKS